MAEQVLNQFRSDKKLREECQEIYEAMGMDLNTAFRMFMERTRMDRGLPFPAVLPEGYKTKTEEQKEHSEQEAPLSEAENSPEMEPI